MNTTAPDAAGPFCLLCPLFDACGEGDKGAVAPDAGLLSQVTRAAGNPLSKFEVAARMTESNGDDAQAIDMSLGGAHGADVGSRS